MDITEFSPCVNRCGGRSATLHELNVTEHLDPVRNLAWEQYALILSLDILNTVVPPVGYVISAPIRGLWGSGSSCRLALDLRAIE